LKTLIIGYGNTLRGDDAFGVRAVEALEEAGMPADVDLLTCQQLTPELVEELAFCDRVAFLDASIPDDNPPGTIRLVKLEPRPVDPGAITHGFDAPGLLALTGMLYGHIPEAVLFTVTAAGFDLTESLSVPVDRAFPDLLKQVRAWAIPAPD
jgi:hydrogenase maturation protease